MAAARNIATPELRQIIVGYLTGIAEDDYVLGHVNGVVEAILKSLVYPVQWRLVLAAIRRHAEPLVEQLDFARPGGEWRPMQPTEYYPHVVLNRIFEAIQREAAQMDENVRRHGRRPQTVSQGYGPIRHHHRQPRADPFFYVAPSRRRSMPGLMDVPARRPNVSVDDLARMLADQSLGDQDKHTKMKTNLYRRRPNGPLHRRRPSGRSCGRSRGRSRGRPLRSRKRTRRI